MTYGTDYRANVSVYLLIYYNFEEKISWKTSTWKTKRGCKGLIKMELRETAFRVKGGWN